VTVTFIEPTSARALHEIAHLPGVIHCEPFRSVPVRLRFGHRYRQLGVMGLPPDSALYRVLDRHHRAVHLPPQGLVMSAKLAELLDLQVGDVVVMEVLEGQRPVVQAPVGVLVDDYAGANAYMDVTALQRLLGEGQTLSGAFLSVDPRHTGDLYTQLKQTPRVAGVTIRQAVVKNFWDTVAENILIMRTFNVIFACIIAVGVVYNTARISLAERSRELATLRVIGFTRAEISGILLGELAVLTLAAIPVGLVIGYTLAGLACAALSTELFRIPLVVYPSTFAFAAVVVLAAAVVSGLIVRRKLDHLDLVAVLKSKE
jgi:putative ABC transport system permease protein